MHGKQITCFKQITCPLSILIFFHPVSSRHLITCNKDRLHCKIREESRTPPLLAKVTLNFSLLFFSFVLWKQVNKWYEIWVNFHHLVIEEFLKYTFDCFLSPILKKKLYSWLLEILWFLDVNCRLNRNKIDLCHIRKVQPWKEV